MHPRIILWDAGLGLIIAYPSGVIYTNQTMGNICMQSEQEGVFVPFDAEDAWLRLSEYFEGPKYSGSGAMHGIDREDADYIDAVLQEAKLWGPGSFVVDRSRLDESHEAWVHVLLYDQPHALFAGFDPYPRPGVLTWPNSD